jgi:hypothetical protein
MKKLHRIILSNWSSFFLVAWLLTFGASIEPGRAAVPSNPAKGFQTFEVEGTALQLRHADGRMLAEEEILGATLTLSDVKGTPLLVRIDGIEHDEKDPSLVFYNFSSRDPRSGAWQPICEPDYEGKTLGFLLQAETTPTGEYVPSADTYSLQCTSGASGKCVRWGYKPWAKGSDGRSLWAHHQACTRMARADYCGNGTPHTKDGTLINLYDPLQIQVSETLPTFQFEAAWGPQGAVCVRKVRWPDLLSLETLAEVCPRLRGKLGEACSEAAASVSGRALIFNESK